MRCHTHPVHIGRQAPPRADRSAPVTSASTSSARRRVLNEATWMATRSDSSFSGAGRRRRVRLRGGRPPGAATPIRTPATAERFVGPGSTRGRRPGPPAGSALPGDRIPALRATACPHRSRRGRPVRCEPSRSVELSGAVESRVISSATGARPRRTKASPVTTMATKAAEISHAPRCPPPVRSARERRCGTGPTPAAVTRAGRGAGGLRGDARPEGRGSRAGGRSPGREGAESAAGRERHARRLRRPPRRVPAEALAAPASPGSTRRRR